MSQIWKNFGDAYVGDILGECVYGTVLFVTVGVVFGKVDRCLANLSFVWKQGLFVPAVISYLFSYNFFGKIFKFYCRYNREFTFIDCVKREQIKEHPKSPLND